MGLLSPFYPSAMVSSAYDIPYEELYKKGFRGLIFDIDNTLVLHGEPWDQASRLLFERLRRIGFHALVLSNNKEERVRPFAEGVGCAYLCKAGKPKRSGYLEALKRMGTTAENTLTIGDQLFTDIWGANRAGIRSLLVKPLGPEKELQIILKRIPEKLVLFCYRKRRGSNYRKHSDKETGIRHYDQQRS